MNKISIKRKKQIKDILFNSLVKNHYLRRKLFIMGSEIVSLNVGQAGCEIATSVWQLYAAEHNIDANGKRSNEQSEEDGCDCFFAETLSGQYVPRTILVDSEPTVVDKIRHSQQKHLFNPTSIINGEEDAASNFARAYFQISSTQTSVRNLVLFLLTHFSEQFLLR